MTARAVETLAGFVAVPLTFAAIALDSGWLALAAVLVLAACAALSDRALAADRPAGDGDCPCWHCAGRSYDPLHPGGS